MYHIFKTLSLRALQAKANKGWGLLLLSYATLGVVYGDIGTSPLYTFASVFPDGAPNDENRILGTLSTIFWTITSVVLVKYVLLMLRADDNGEGGIISLYSIIKRAAGIPTLTALSTGAEDLDSSLLTEGGRVSRAVRTSLHRSRWQQLALLSIVVVAVNMIISDGVLTPAISVVSAVQGIQAYNGPAGPSLITNGAVVGITCGILVMLFLLQSWGTERVTFLFSPIILLWFVANAVIGVYNIEKYRPSVFKGLSPSYMYYYWSGDASSAWINLGSVMLSITGAEALYADLGHFSARSIQLSFLTIVFPSLTITYLGQAAFILENKEAAGQVFWASIPRSVYVPMVILATAAAIIASQALISGAFSITRQGISIKLFPRFTVKHTSAHAEGQIYIPEINYALMVGCVVIVVAFQNATSIGNAYGLAIVMVMVMDTFLLSLVMLVAWDWNALLVGFFWLFYTFISGAYLSSNLRKVPLGAWFSLVLSGILSIIVGVYYWGQTTKANYLRKNAIPLSALFAVAGDSEQRPTHRLAATARPNDDDADDASTITLSLHPDLQPLKLAGSGQPVARFPGVGLYYSELLEGVPPVLVRFLSLSPAIHEVVIFLTIRGVPLPQVSPTERLLVRKLGFHGFYHVVARYGYLEDIDQGEAFVKDLVEEIVEYLQPGNLDDLMSVPEEEHDPEIGDVAPLGFDGQGLVVEPGNGSVAAVEEVGASRAEVDIDPSISLNSIAGQRALSHIRSRLRNRSISEEVRPEDEAFKTSNAALTTPREPLSKNADEGTGKSPENVRRPRLTVSMSLERSSVAERSSLPGSGRLGDGAGPWVRQPSVLRRVRTAAIRRDGRPNLPLAWDSAATVPLPPPPPRPLIYRISGRKSVVQVATMSP